MKFTADVNVEDIIKLRQEIDKLKKSLIAVAGIPNSDVAIKQLEKEIAAATKKLEEYENKYLQIQKLKHDIDSSNAAVKKAKEETAALQSTNKWIVANTEAVIETDKQIKQLKKSFVSLADSEKTGSSGTGILRQVQQLAAQRLVEEESIRRTIKAQKDQIIQSRAEEGSITALRKQIILLTKDQRPFFYFMKTRPNTSYTETPIRVAILIDGGYFIKRYNAMYTFSLKYSFVLL